MNRETYTIGDDIERFLSDEEKEILISTSCNEQEDVGNLRRKIFALLKIIVFERANKNTDSSAL